MSSEHLPQGDHSLSELAELCERALAKEDWDVLDAEDPDYSHFESVNLCEELMRGFVRRYHIIHQPNALTSAELPPYLSSIILKNPWLYLPQAMPDGGALMLRVKGEIPLPYMGLILYESYNMQGESYEGPHLAGVIDTNRLNSDKLAQAGIAAGTHTFFIPYHEVEVSDRHIPHLFN